MVAVEGGVDAVDELVGGEQAGGLGEAALAMDSLRLDWVQPGLLIGLAPSRGQSREQLARKPSPATAPAPAFGERRHSGGGADIGEHLIQTHGFARGVRLVKHLCRELLLQ